MNAIDLAPLTAPNPAHDYPQRIRYWRQGKLLMAEFSKLDGSQTERWNYRPVVPPRDQVE